MSDAKKIFNQTMEDATNVGSLFLKTVCGDTRSARAIGKKLAVDAARERGQIEIAKVIDAEFEEGPTK